LQLPPRSRLHDVFHVSQLKPFRVEPTSCCPPLPAIHHGHVIPTPLHVLKAQLYRGVRQLLVHWEGAAASEASWEDSTKFQRRYPSFKLEDELLVEGGSDVMWGKQYSHLHRHKSRDVEDIHSQDQV
jgi:hypothetical protein